MYKLAFNLEETAQAHMQYVMEIPSAIHRVFVFPSCSWGKTAVDPIPSVKGPILEMLCAGMELARLLL